MFDHSFLQALPQPSIKRGLQSPSLMLEQWGLPHGDAHDEQDGLHLLRHGRGLHDDLHEDGDHVQSRYGHGDDHGDDGDGDDGVHDPVVHHRVTNFL